MGQNAQISIRFIAADRPWMATFSIKESFEYLRLTAKW